jgi:hypothetical protein
MKGHTNSQRLPVCDVPSILKQGLIVSFTVITLFSTRQEAMGITIKMSRYGMVEFTQAPISILNCGEKATPSSHSADCYALYLCRLMDPSLLSVPVTTSQSFQESCSPSTGRSTYLKSPFLSVVGERRPERKPLAFKCLHRMPEWSEAVR